jgi:MFS family permease
MSSSPQQQQQHGELSSLLSDPESSGKLPRVDDDAAPPPPSLAASYASLLICMMCLSIDYSVVMPSLWLFLRSLDPDVPEAILGVGLSAFQLSSVCFSPLMGLWLDRRPTKEVVVMQIWISVAGNIMYSFSTHVWMVVASRFVCGLGSTVGLSASVFVIRSTTEENRSSAFTKLYGVTLLGLLIGPVFNYPLTQLPHFVIMGVTMNSLNSVGLLMAVIMLLALLMVHILFREPPESAPAKEEHLTWVEKMRSIASVGTVSLAITAFVSSMNQVSLEASLPPITLLYYGFGQLQNSYVYTALTGYLLVWYLINGFFLTQKLQDRVRLLLAWCCVGAGTLFLILTGVLQGRTWYFWEFCVGSALVATSIPFFDSATGSLFSKMHSNPSLQGRAQGILSMAKGVGILIGPLIAAPVLSISPIYVFVFVGSAFVVTMPLFLFSFRHLVPSSELIAVESEKVIN